MNYHEVENQKFKVIDVKGLSSKQLEDEMNKLVARGYKRVFQSTIEWFQGKGDWGVITFELVED